MTLPEIRHEYGSLRAACQWYGRQLRMSKTMTAAELGVPEATFHRWLTRHGLHDLFYPRRGQRAECRGAGIERPGAGNREPVRLSRRKPIRHNGQTYHPGEPMHHFLFERGR